MYILPSTQSDFFLFTSSEYLFVLPSAVEPSPTVETNELLITMTVIVAGLTLLTLLVIAGVIICFCFFRRIRKSPSNISGTLNSATPNQYLEIKELKIHVSFSFNCYKETVFFKQDNKVAEI